jgi:exodeoxyribonuclease VII large subunit
VTQAADAGVPEVPVYAVDELLTGLSRLLEDRVGRVHVRGEISNLFESPAGHRYFTLKGEAAQVRAVFFRGAARNLRFDLEEGLEVQVYAEVSIYPQRGDLQLIVRQVEPVGAGALRRALEELRRRLEAEGLFDDARKEALPTFPRGIAIVTSPRGAALRDVLRVAAGRFPGLPLKLLPTRVQGEGAPAEIVAALRDAGEAPGVDVVLLVRGGGSLEDLAAFSTEEVVRAVAACPLPVVCGVGHEVDFSLADAAADVRAATPSTAAALAVPDCEAFVQRVARSQQRLRQAALRALAWGRAAWRSQHENLRLAAPSAQLATRRVRSHSALRALQAAIQMRLYEARGCRDEWMARLDALSPLAVLDRGYAVARRTRDGAVLRRSDQLVPGEKLSIRLAAAQVEATADAIEALDRADKVS